MPDYVLEIVEGPEAGRQIPLAGPVVLGRDPSGGVAPAAGRAPLPPARPADAGERRRPRRGPRLAQRHLRGRRPDLLAGASRARRAAPPRRDRAPARARPRGRARRDVGAPDPGEPHDHAAAARRGLARADRRAPGADARDPRGGAGLRPGLAARGAPRARATPRRMADLLPLLDVHTKGKARGAPIGIFVLCVLAVVLYLALR